MIANDVLEEDKKCESLKLKIVVSLKVTEGCLNLLIKRKYCKQQTLKHECLEAQVVGSLGHLAWIKLLTLVHTYFKHNEYGLDHSCISFQTFMDRNIL